MIFPYISDGKVLACNPGDLECTSCGKPISSSEKMIQFWWTDVKLNLHPDCAEHVALMIMRDVAECRCGKEIANARYRQVRKIVPHPK